MARITIKLDQRRANKRGEYPIYIVINHARSNTLVATGVSCLPKDYEGGDAMHTLAPKAPNAKTVNRYICDLYNEVMQFIYELDKSGRLDTMTCAEVRTAFEQRNVQEVQEPKETFTEHLAALAATKEGKYRQSFDYTMSWLQQFHPDPIEFEALDFAFLRKFDLFLQGNNISPNSRGIIFRNMRTALNDAINNDLTDCYPFRKFKIPHAQKDKTYLRLNDFKQLLAYQPKTDGEQTAKDLFLLSFYLCGANPIDIFNMKPAHNGYISFVRTKTRSKTQSDINIKLQPEAIEIIERHKGNTHLLDFIDNYLSYENFYHFMGKKIRHLSKILGIEGLSLYWARYSWATYASRCGIDESVIGRSLGHAPSSLAGRVYITFDWERVDEANRRVIDYLHAK